MKGGKSGKEYLKAAFESVFTLFLFELERLNDHHSLIYD